MITKAYSHHVHQHGGLASETCTDPSCADVVDHDYRAAFEAMREALHQTCDRLERSDFPEGGDTERALNQAYDALKLADKVTR